MKIRPITRAQLDNVSQGIALLRAARNCFRRADCPQTLKRVRLALTSAAGAERHSLYRYRRQGGPV